MRHPEPRANLELVTLYEICKLFGASLNVSRSFREVLKVLHAHLGYERTMLLFLDEESETLRLYSANGLTDEQMERAQYAPGEGVIGRVFESDVPMVVTDGGEDTPFLNRVGAFGQTHDGVQSAFMAVPVRFGNEKLGVLACDRPMQSPSARVHDDLRLLTMLATLMGQQYALNRSLIEEQSHMQRQNAYLQKQLQTTYSVENVVGVSERMQQVFSEVHQAAPTRSTVLLRGESGTGKEAIAHAIHQLSPRKDKPFVKINCAALSETLLESELFGHERGAFTGASGERKGRFEMANGGTLFMDEIGDISPAFQAKLLRVLQEREFERVGGNKPIKVDVRLICATNRNLEKMVVRGEFRSDLYYRIYVVSINLPPLREHRDDIPMLVEHFLKRYNADNLRDLKMSSRAMNILKNCYWPGNVRELENCVERVATMTQGGVIHDTAFPCMNHRCLTQMLHNLEKDDAVAPAEPAAHAFEAPEEFQHHHTRPVRIPVVAEEPMQTGPGLGSAPLPAVGGSGSLDPEKQRLIWALEQCGWVQAKAARLLKISPRQLGYALQKHHIEVRKF